jgi:hypothetical protein
MAKDLTKTDRTCAECNTTFGAVADFCICTNCGHSFHASHTRTEPVEPTIPHEDALLLAGVLSGESPEVLGRVQLSIDDPPQYFDQFGKHSQLCESVHDVDPLFAAHDILTERGFVGYIDWRSDPDELCEAMEPLLEKSGLQDFDWSFLDELVESDDSEMLKNENLLNLVSDKIAERGMLFIHLFMGWDNYDFAIVSQEAFDKIKHMRGSHFEVRRRFD